jgi:hypothetical protein
VLLDGGGQLFQGLGIEVFTRLIGVFAEVNDGNVVEFAFFILWDVGHHILYYPPDPSRLIHVALAK